ncbi:MAG: ATP synthase F1 subunit epsilon [Hyphomicrobiaceae bacterium]
MAGTFKFELVSPEKVLLSGDASEAIVPGMDGQFTVLPGHAPVISTLKPGRMRVTVDGRERSAFVRGGVVEVEPDSVTVLAQHLIDLDGENRREAIDAEIKYAEELLAAAKDDTERMVVQEALVQLRHFAVH